MKFIEICSFLLQICLRIIHNWKLSYIDDTLYNYWDPNTLAWSNKSIGLTTEDANTHKQLVLLMFIGLDLMENDDVIKEDIMVIILVFILTICK